MENANRFASITIGNVPPRPDGARRGAGSGKPGIPQLPRRKVERLFHSLFAFHFTALDPATVGAGAAVRDSIVFPGGEVPAETIAIGAILGQGDIVTNLRPAADLA